MLQDTPTLVPTTASQAKNKSLRQRSQLASDRTASAWRSLQWLFWLAIGGFMLMVVLRSSGQSVETIAGSFLIIMAAMFPSYLWISRKVRGLPLFPACALTYIWTFALPLTSENRTVVQFSSWDNLVAALSVTGFLLIGTLVWYLVGRRPAVVPKVCWMVNDQRSEPLLLIALACCALWSMAFSAGWIDVPIGLSSLFRAVEAAISALVCFSISYRIGLGTLSKVPKVLFLWLLGFLFLSNLASLLMFIPMSLSAVALLAYVAASKQLPWRIGTLALCAFAFLHAGKNEMRQNHWNEAGGVLVQPTQYPGFFFEWIEISLKFIQEKSPDNERGETLLERASLMHWLLYFQRLSPSTLPYLHGTTYAVIPRLLVPRFLDPTKPLSTEGITLIAVHYGIMTREETESTTIGFGLLSEAYANFGFLGILGLAIVQGAFYGQVARWARGVPILSFRGLFAVSIASYAIQTEFSATFYATALFQSTVILAGLTILFMRPRRFSSASASLLD